MTLHLRKLNHQNEYEVCQTGCGGVGRFKSDNPGLASAHYQAYFAGHPAGFLCQKCAKEWRTIIESMDLEVTEKREGRTNLSQFAGSL